MDAFIKGSFIGNTVMRSTECRKNKLQKYLGELKITKKLLKISILAHYQENKLRYTLCQHFTSQAVYGSLKRNDLLENLLKSFFQLLAILHKGESVTSNASSIYSKKIGFRDVRTHFKQI